MTVRAKFTVTRITEGSEGLKTIDMLPVVSSDPDSENAKFFKYTPSGSINLGTINPAASNQFEEGKEYYVDFSPAE